MATSNSSIYRLSSCKLQCFLAAILLCSSSYSQPKSLQIGDTLPNIHLTNLINYKSSSAQLSDFKGKTVILDFFATWCTACLKALPHLDSLQQQFGDKLAVWVVTAEPAEKIEAFRKKNKVFRSINLPFVTNDSMLNILFPHLLVPHEVWIGADGIITAITGEEEVTAANISAMIDAKPLRLPLKKDRMDFDYHKPLLQNGNGGGEEDLLYRSVWAGRLKGISSSGGHVQQGKSIRYYYINSPVLSLYQNALGFPPNRVILEVKDPARYIWSAGATEEWKDNNLYTYELTVPANTGKKELKNLLLSDLNRCLHLSAGMEIRKIKCWALTGGGSTDSLLATKGLQSHIKFDESRAAWLFINQPLQVIINTLNTLNTPLPGKPVFLNETEFPGNADIEIPEAAMHDPLLLQKLLHSYGLSLLPVEREIEMFVVKEQ